MKKIIYFISGGFIAQLATVSVSPILSRLYNPDDFGIFAVITSTIYFINAFSLARLEIELLNKKNSKEELYKYSLGFLLFITISCTLLFYALTNFKCEYIYYIFPFLIFFNGYYNLSYYNLLSENKISRINLSKIVLSITIAFTQVLFGFFEGGAVGLILGHFTGFFISILLMDKHFFGIEFRGFFKKFKKNIFIDAPAVSLTILSNHGPTYLMFFFLGEVISGAYFMSFRLLITPIGIISDSISNYISMKFGCWNQIYNEQEKILYILILLSIFPMAIAYAYIDSIILFFLGDKWIEASKISKIIITWIYLRFFFDSFIINFSLLKVYHVNFFYQAFSLCIRMLSILVPYFLGFNWFQVVLIFSMFSILLYAIGILILSYFLKFNMIRIFLIILAYIIIAFIYLLGEVKAHGYFF